MGHLPAALVFWRLPFLWLVNGSLVAGSVVPTTCAATAPPTAAGSAIRPNSYTFLQLPLAERQFTAAHNGSVCYPTTRTPHLADYRVVPTGPLHCPSSNRLAVPLWVYWFPALTPTACTVPLLHRRQLPTAARFSPHTLPPQQRHLALWRGSLYLPCPLWQRRPLTHIVPG